MAQTSMRRWRAAAAASRSTGFPTSIELALPTLKDFRHIILVETADPVSFFAYPNKPSILKPEGCQVHRFTATGENSVAALEALAAAVGARPRMPGRRS